MDSNVGDSKIIQLVDFGNFMIFESASIQTMIMLFSKNSNIDNYVFDYRKLNGNTSLADTLDLLNKRINRKASYTSPRIIRDDFKDSFLTFSSNELILAKIAENLNTTFLSEKEVIQGIVPNPDVVNNRNIQKISREKIEKYNISVGKGVFVLENREKINFPKSEYKYIKPLFEPVNINKYSISRTDLNIIYITKNNFRNDAPQIIQHLDKYREIMDDRRENQNGRLDFYHLHWPRDDSFFKAGAKILSVRKCAIPTFAYTTKEVYVMMAVNIIKSNRLDLKYLTGLFNSNLIAFWLKNKGKLQGDNYQIDKEPLLQIPIRVGNEYQVKSIIRFVEQIISLKEINPNEDICNIEKEIDNIIYDIYNLTEDEIEIIINN